MESSNTSYQNKYLDKSKIRDDMYILCESENACMFLFRELDKLGFTWPKGGSLSVQDTHWPDIRQYICYKIHLDNKTIQYNDEENLDYLRRDWNVIHIDDLIKKELHLSDLDAHDQQNIKDIVDMFHDYRKDDEEFYLICRDRALLNLLIEGIFSFDWYITNERAWESRNYHLESDAIGVYFAGNSVYQLKDGFDLSKGYQEIDWDYVHMFDTTYKKLNNPWQEFPPKVKFVFNYDESDLETIVGSEDVPKSSESIKKEKENTSMNMFGNLNMEFGMNTDERIRSTFMGIAVQHEGTWKIYDKSAKTLTDIGDLDVGTLPLFVMPATKLEEGDLIKRDDSYYYVVESADNKIRTISATTGKMEAAVPTDNILGIRFYSKIVAIAEDIISDISGDDSTDKLMMAMAMSSMSNDPEGTGNENTAQNNQMLLPLLLMKDKKADDTEGGSDKKSDMLKKFMLMSMMTNNNSASNQNAWLPLLLMKDDLF